MTTKTEAAVSIFVNNYNCSQSVLAAFAPDFGVDEKTALRMASPFGGGLARKGDVCGAVTGGLMALGLARGTDTPASKEVIYRLSREFMSRFEKKHGSIVCRTLIDCDLATPEGSQAATAKGVFRSICPDLVRDAAEIVQELLKDA